MIYLLLFLFCVVTALGVGLLAAWSDFRGMTIPNSYSVIIIALFFPAVLGACAVQADFFSPVLWHIGAGLMVLFVGFGLYALRLLGGGDSKLLAAYAVWVGVKGLPVLLFYMGISGALLGLAAIIIRRRRPFTNVKEGSWFARLQAGDNHVPYGIAIVVGAFAAFFDGGYINPDQLTLFLEH